MLSLPSPLLAVPALTDSTTSLNQLTSHQPGIITNPQSTPIYICAFEKCNRLWPSYKSLMAHRKKDHNTEDDSQIITWNEEPGIPKQTSPGQLESPEN